MFSTGILSSRVGYQQLIFTELMEIMDSASCRLPVVMQPKVIVLCIVTFHFCNVMEVQRTFAQKYGFTRILCMGLILSKNYIFK